MAKLVFGMNQSLDGYVDHTKFGPSLELFLHWVEHVRGLSGIVYGRGMYEVMRYWDEDHADWKEHEHAFAAAWRAQPKWVMSKTLKEVGPNATLVGEDVEGVVRRLKAERDGEIGLGGPVIARSLGAAGLIDEYRLYVHPVVVGEGPTFFGGPRPRLKLKAHELVAEDVVRLTYVPA